MRFPNLFSPLAIGAVTVKNRIVSSGHDTSMAHDGQITDGLIAYQKARARGGAGLIIAQAAGIHDSARYTSHVLMASDDSCIDGYRRLSQAVHAFDSLQRGSKPFHRLHRSVLATRAALVGGISQRNRAARSLSSPAAKNSSWISVG